MLLPFLHFFFSLSFFSLNDLPTNWLTDWLTDWLTNWLTGWMTEWMDQRKWANEKCKGRKCFNCWCVAAGGGEVYKRLKKQHFWSPFCWWWSCWWCWCCQYLLSLLLLLLLLVLYPTNILSRKKELKENFWVLLPEILYIRNIYFIYCVFIYFGWGRKL